nr:hypothetical protein [uncultured Aminipila sp.]
MSKKRILYLTNHVTLSKFEIPMLQNMGYEIYMPKKPAFDISCTVDWELDTRLTIPEADIKILNEADFYYRPIDRKTTEVINKYFDIAFIVSIPIMLRSIVDHFNGQICLRAYGNNISYTEVLTFMCGSSFISKLEKIGNRFWFGAGYESIAEKESRVLKGRTLFMPLGLPNAKVDDKWTGEGETLLFPCPKIRTEGFFDDVYTKFKKDFKGFPYKVIGVQPLPVTTDSNVLGYLSNEEYNKIYATSSCMFYYSQIKSHIHYTPFEAIKAGLPLLYMADGLLDTIGGENLPGRCKDIKEARKKAKRLINNDKTLAKEIRDTQPVLLEILSEQYCEKYWLQAMDKMEKNIEKEEKSSKISQCSKICIVLPCVDNRFQLKYSIAFTKALHQSIKNKRDNVELVFAYIDDNIYDEKDLFKDICDLNIQTRKFSWETISHKRLASMLDIKDIKQNIYFEEYAIPNDGLSYFRDCDHIIFTSDFVPNNFYSYIPYSVILNGYPQRLCNELITSNEENNAILQFARSAKNCWGENPITLETAIQYAGTQADYTEIIPPIIDEINFSEIDTRFLKLPEKFIVWNTNILISENHKFVLNELYSYYLKGGQYKCYVIGQDTEMFNPKNDTDDKYIKEVQRIIKEKKLLHKNLVFLGDIRDDLYLSILKKAHINLQSGYPLKGNYNYFYAAYFGVPTVAANYAVIEYMSNYFQLRVSFFDRFNPENLSYLLVEVEKNIEEIRKAIPSKTELDKFTIKEPKVLENIYNEIKYKLGL